MSPTRDAFRIVLDATQDLCYNQGALAKSYLGFENGKEYVNGHPPLSIIDS
jgi:hypothetical protein